MTGERYTIDELITLHELHEELQEVITEGRVDAGIVRHCLRQSNLASVDVFPVDERVEVPAEVVEESQQSNNARGRVAALVARVPTRLEVRPARITGIVDADFQHALDGETLPEGVLLTDYSSMEMYALAKSSLHRFVDLCLHDDGARESFVSTVLEVLTVLRFVFVARWLWACDSVEWSIPGRLDRLVSREAGGLNLDLEAFCRASLSASGLSADDVAAYALKIRNIGLRLSCEPRASARWHDVSALLPRVMGWKNDLAKQDLFERALVACLESQDVLELPMFRQLVDRLRP